ncbi:MAG TPA: hypothetical protein VFI15_08510 [Candidatus Limnocylindrales bacterium]|nr:hypothetical protein [Candidatus Limnocylindrales bacterium]
MTSNQKRGFRLPWGSERGSEDGAGAATLDRPEAAMDATDDIGAGPFRLATDQPDTSSEAAMIDSDAPTTESAEAPPAVVADAPGGWPTTDRRGAAAPTTAADERPPIRVDGQLRTARRDNPLVAGLVKAMREAAIASRAETTAKLQSEATSRVEAIRGRATTEAAELRKRADDDVSEIRDWSKLELARIRQQTEDRIEARKTELTGEIDRHAATVERLVDQVQTTVSAFEAEMDQFFAQLLAENDPARLAGLAERAPEPPDLAGEAPSAMDAQAENEATMSAGTDTPGSVELENNYWAMPEPAGETAATSDAVTDPAPEPAAAPPAILQADAAAEAEAEAREGLDPNALEAWPTVAPAANRPDPAATATGDVNGPDSTRLFVHGLTSVAQISSFKGGLAAVHGVRSVSVSSGERGVFIFTVSHDPGVDLDSGVAGLSAFSARVTDATDDGFTVSVGESGK